MGGYNKDKENRDMIGQIEEFDIGKKEKQYLYSCVFHLSHPKALRLW